MTTITDICTAALREAGIVEVGGTPDADETTEAFNLLQRLYTTFFGNELGDQLMTVNYGTYGMTNAEAIEADQSSFIDSIFVPENVRVVLNVSSPNTIHLYPNPMDGARLSVIDNAGTLASNNIILDGNGRHIEGNPSVTLNTNNYLGEWFYRADLGNWTKVVTFALTDPSPLPAAFDDLLITALAIRLNPRYGAKTSQEMMGVLDRMRRQFRSRYRQTNEQRAEDALIRIPSNKYWRYRNSATAFNRGKLA